MIGTPHRLSKANRPQRGFALLLIVLSLLGVLAAIFFTDLASGGGKIARDARTAVALAKAKDALLAYVVSRDDPGQPGEFPCPTTVVPTSATYGTSDSGCATRRIGRLPWKTLGIPELLDSDGEPLWYAVSDNFRPPFSPTRIVNTDTLGALVIYAAGGSVQVESQAVAVIFSAGAPLSAQNRTASVVLCTTTSTSIAANTCPANYLDSGSGRNNATNAGPYIADRSSATFNDQVVYITTADFMPKIEDRVETILRRALNKYYLTNGYYPQATNYTDLTTPNRLSCANGSFSGRLPLYVVNPSSSSPCTGQAEWPGVAATDSLPAWFTTNEWNAGIHYVVGKAFAIGGTKTCVIAGDCLTVDGDNTVQAAFILTGTATSTQSRPSASPANYLEAVANQEDWPTPMNYTYATTVSKLPSRDRVIAIKNP